MTYLWIVFLIGCVVVPLMADRARREWDRNSMDTATRLELRKAERTLADAKARAAGARAAERITRRLGYPRNL